MHALKVQMIHDIELDTSSNGYDVVRDFFKENLNIITSLEKKMTSPFTGDLIKKYFTVDTMRDPSTGKRKIEITAFDDCPVWIWLTSFEIKNIIRS